MVANSGRAASSVKAAAAAGGDRRPAFTELANRPNSGRRIRRLIDTLVIALIPENASRTEWRTGPWRQSADSDDLARVYRFDLAPPFRFDVARGARRSGCLFSGIG